MAVKVGRNDACPCGSGQKYKKCCMAADAGMKPIHQVDNQLRQQLMDYSRVKFGQDAFAEVKGEAIPEDVLPLFIPWMLFHHRIDGQSVAEWYAQEHGPSLDPTEQAWLAAQQRTPMSVWKVVDVIPGRGLRLEDAFTGQQRTVSDIDASRSLKPLTYLLLRVTDFEDYTVLTGAHPQPLTPLDAFQLQQAYLAQLQRAVQPEDLLQGPATLQLLRLWIRIVDAGSQPAARSLSNHDGDVFELTSMRMSFDRSQRKDIVDSLLNASHADVMVESIEPDLILYSRRNEAASGQWTGTVVASVLVGADTLEVQTNSARRAQSYRALIEADTHGQVHYQDTVPLDVGTYTQTLHRAAPTQQPSLDGGMEAMRLFKAQHYQAWLDEKLQALNLQSPRQAVATAEGRRQVAALLDDMAFREQQEPLYVRYDFTPLRQELGV